MLAKRLKEVLPKLIGDNQFAFLGERNMLDSVLIVNEIIAEAKNKKKQPLFSRWTMRRRMIR